MHLVIRHSLSANGRRHPRRGGFVLLITITLLAFLVLLLVSLASLTRVETEVAANHQSLGSARQNALLALNIALGQLQKHTGPDRRVTARADLALPSGVTVTPPTFDFGTGPTGGKFTAPGSTGKAVLADVDAYWGDTATPRNRHWTGVWRNTNRTAFDPNNPSAFNPSPGCFINDDPAQPSAKPVWLVSGIEAATAPDPASAIAGLSIDTTAVTDSLRDAAHTPHRLLVGASTTRATGAADLQRYVTVPQLPIKGTAPGQTGEQDIGNYAWWIGDEGLKARADLLDPFGLVSGTASIDPRSPRNLKRRQSAQRPVIEAMTTNGGDGLAPFFTDLSNDPRLRGVFSIPQLGYLKADSTFRAQLGQRHHDLTMHSRGVLADTLHGGLRRDLGYILGRPSLAEFRSALNQSGFSVAPAATYNTALSPAATPYATLPANEPAGRAYDAAAGVLGGSASWEQLWSFYNMGEPAPLGVFSGAVANSRPSSGTQQGLYPLLVQAKLFYSMQVSGGAITLRITPVVVLANPYNVPLGGVFRLTFANAPVVVTGKLGPIPPASTDLIYAKTGASGVNRFVPAGAPPNNLANATLANGGLGQATLVINATSIPAGVAQIFTVVPGSTINGKNHALDVPMVNTFDPSAYVTCVTGLSINTAAGDTHAALYASGMAAQLHMGATNDVNRVAYVSTKSPPAAPGAPLEFGFVVYPVDVGLRRGGGVFFALQDGKSETQQSLFYQVNYRTLIANHIGDSGFGDHPLQWGVCYGILGLEDDDDSGPHPLLSANILAPLEETIPATTRWGLVASGEYPSLNTVPPEITDAKTGFVNRLYDIPAPGRPINSLGQLQHFNLAGHLSNPAAGESVKTNSFLVNYPIANSYPGPRVRRHKVFHSSDPFSHHYDASYIWNDLLWDRFTFSGYPQSESFAFDDSEAGHLINSRYRPFRPEAEVAHDDESRFRGVFEPAKNLLVTGAFNINSTSVEAWKALFSSLKGVPIGSVASPSAPFSRTLSPDGGSSGARNGVSADSWNGFNDLTQAEINELAEEMVLQVRLRGPFLSLSEFVNRRLIQGPASATNAGLADPHRLGLSGALQAALDKVINRNAVVPAPYNLASKRNENGGPRDGTGAFFGLYLADLEYRLHNRLAGHPGYLLQGDVLSVIAPNLSARSDTFTIRTYGDSANPVTGNIEGRAWCEAVVQRLPDHIDPSLSAETSPGATTPNDLFGRRYRIVSFRWLTAADI